MTSFLTKPISFWQVNRKNAVEKIAKPRAVPTISGASTFAIAKSNNYSNYVDLTETSYL